MLKQVLVFFLLVTAVFAEVAYFAISTHHEYTGDFVVKLTDDKLIKHARDLVNGETTDQPHLVGRIVKRPQPYNPRYSFFIDSNTISFFNHAIEVCDATFSYTEEHLDEACGAFLPGCMLCPWTSRVLREINPSLASGYQASFRTGGRYLYQEPSCN